MERGGLGAAINVKFRRWYSMTGQGLTFKNFWPDSRRHLSSRSSSPGIGASRCRGLARWRAIAEAYLTEHRDFCSLAGWRDERKSGSSLPGADLVGFNRMNRATGFVSRVKTSGEAKYAPVRLWRTGLKQQLEDLGTRWASATTCSRYLVIAQECNLAGPFQTASSGISTIRRTFSFWRAGA